MHDILRIQTCWIQSTVKEIGVAGMGKKKTCGDKVWGKWCSEVAAFQFISHKKQIGWFWIWVNLKP